MADASAVGRPPAPEAVLTVPCGAGAELHLYATPPSDPRLAAADVFNVPGYFGLHAGAFSVAYYGVVRHAESLAPLAVAQLAEVAPGHFRSPGRGSYGGVQFLQPRPDVAFVESVVDAVLRALAALGATRVAMVLPPADYDPPTSALLTHVLWRAGFSIEGHELNYAIPIAGGSLLPRIDHGNRKRVQAAQRLGLRFHHLADDELDAAYGVVAENRAKRGYSLSMSLQGLREMSRALPGRVRCFGARHDGVLVASAVCVDVNPDVLYVFYWGEIAGVERLSPVAFLATELYTVCVREDRRMLDIGTSTLHGVPNYGLIRFKKNLGCRESLKLTLGREIPSGVAG